MPTSLVSALLLHRASDTTSKWDSPVSRSELVDRFSALRGDVARCKRDVGFSGEDADAVNVAVSELILCYLYKAFDAPKSIQTVYFPNISWIYCEITYT